MLSLPPTPYLALSFINQIILSSDILCNDFIQNDTNLNIFDHLFLFKMLVFNVLFRFQKHYIFKVHRKKNIFIPEKGLAK